MRRLSMIAAAARASVVDAREPFLHALSAAHAAATSPRNRVKAPTQAQMRAGNYLMGPVTWHRHRLHIENAAHTVREGEDEDGKPWRNMMQAHYGYFVGTRGADGDGIDVFLGPLPESKTVWVLNQTNAAGEFDEHKVLAGFVDERAALDAYRLSYASGWDRFKPPIRLSLAQLDWWLSYADTTRELTPDLVPPEPDMDTTTPTPPELSRVLWDSAAMPAQAGATLATVLYTIRANDGAEGLVMDPLTMADIMEDAEVVKLDALVTLVGKLQPKMQALLRIMQMAADDTVAPLAFQISEPMRRYGGVHVAALFELADGQTVTIWLHNPDSTPAKLTPADELVSWKWQLNKKDITIVVAPESGQDLNLREVARRIMRLAAKNSPAFQRANARRTETMAEIAGLKDELATKQGELRTLQGRIEVARVARDDRAAEAAKGPLWKRAGFDPTTESGYALVMEAGEEAAIYWQDALDSFWQGRLVDIRNALRALGWDGPKFGTLSKEGHALKMNVQQVGAGRNVVGATWEIEGVPGFFMSDSLTRSAAEMAANIDLGLTSFLALRASQDPKPVAGDDPFASFGAWKAAVIAAVEQLGDTEKAAAARFEAREADMQAAYAARMEVAQARDMLYFDKEAPQPGDPVPASDWNAWVEAITAAVESRLGATRSDAQGMVEAKDAELRKLFSAGYNHETAYASVFADAATDPTPQAGGKFYVMLGDQSVSEHDDIEAAEVAAAELASTDPFAHEGVWVSDADGNSVREIRAAGLPPPKTVDRRSLPDDGAPLLTPEQRTRLAALTREAEGKSWGVGSPSFYGVIPDGYDLPADFMPADNRLMAADMGAIAKERGEAIAVQIDPRSDKPFRVLWVMHEDGRGVGSQWAATAAEAYAMVREAAPDPLVAPAPVAELPDNVFAEIEPEAFALLAQAPKAYAMAAAIERDVRIDGGSVAWVLTTVEPSMPVLDSAAAPTARRLVLDSLFELDGARLIRGDISYGGTFVGAVTINGEGQAFFTDRIGEAFNTEADLYEVQKTEGYRNTEAYRDKLREAAAAGTLGWVDDPTPILEAMLSAGERDAIDEDRRERENTAANEADDADQDGAGWHRGVMDKANEFWKRTLNDVSTGGRTRAADLGTMRISGKDMIVRLIYKGTNAAAWYVALVKPGKRTPAQSLPFPSITGALKMGRIASYVLGYYTADDDEAGAPSNLKLYPPGVEPSAEAQSPVLLHAQAVRSELVKIGYAADDSGTALRVERQGAMFTIRWSYEGPEDAPTGATFRVAKLVDGAQIDDFEFNDIPTSSPEVVAAKIDAYARQMADAPEREEPAESAEVAFLREVKAGAHDALALGELLSKIEANIQALNEAGGLTGDVDALANEAITRWVELDEKANG